MSTARSAPPSREGSTFSAVLAHSPRTDEKILLKANLLVGDAPEKCVNTHPSVLRAVAEIFKTAGARLSYGDSPAVGTARAASRKIGMDAAADEAGIELKEFQPGQEVHFPEGLQNKRFTIARAVLESDGVISLPKLKAHGMQKFTGCVKNQFGCIPGLLKGEFHVRTPDAYAFARMLVDLDRLVHPRLYVMDGIIAMEGNGPRGGTPKKMNVLLFSEDPIAVDATVCRLIDLDPLLVPTIAFGQAAGRGTHEQENIELLGDDFDSFRCRDFVIDRAPIKPYREKGLLRFVSNRLVPKPVIDQGQMHQVRAVRHRVPGETQGGRLAERRQDTAAGSRLSDLHPLLLLPGAVSGKGHRADKAAPAANARF